MAAASSETTDSVAVRYTAMPSELRMIAEETSELCDCPHGVAAIGVTVRVEVGDRDPDQVRRRRQRLRELDELSPVEAKRLRIADGRKDVLVEYVEVEM
jgi:hypothetical protein